MKNKKIYIIAMSIILLISWVDIYSQLPCIPDCETTPWNPLPPTPAETIEVTICGYPFIVEYRWRIACNLYFDYYIEKIGDVSGLHMSSCIQTLGVSGFLRAATEQLIIANPKAFPPINDGDCSTNWRVMKGSCWKYMYVIGTSGSWTYGYPDLVKPCIMNDCCLEFYEVCVINEERVITQTGYQPPNDPNCTWDPSSQCMPVCGSIYR